MSLQKVITKTFETAIRRNWENIYIAVDIHDTIVKSNWNKDVLPTEFYPDSLKALQYLSNRDDVVLIMYTCSWPKEIQMYLDFFESHGIKFQYVNENPEVVSRAYGCYDRKFYFALLFEDKAGFDAENDWKIILEEFKKHPFLSPIK